MHAERVERLPTPRDEVSQLLHVVGHLRFRLGLERLLVFGLRGSIGAMGSKQERAEVMKSGGVIGVRGEDLAIEMLGLGESPGEVMFHRHGQIWRQGHGSDQ